MPRHPLCALSSLTYIAFHTRCSRSRYLKYSFSRFPIRLVTCCAGEPPLAGLPRCPARTAGRLRRCFSRLRAASPRAVVCTDLSAALQLSSVFCLRLSLTSRPAPVNKIGLMCSGRMKVRHQDAGYSIARIGFLIRCLADPLRGGQVAAPDLILLLAPPSWQLTG